jgi:hypothetical protein
MPLKAGQVMISGVIPRFHDLLETIRVHVRHDGQIFER